MSSTVVVQLTGSGRAAVASLLVDGPDAVGTVLRCFRSKSLKYGGLIENKTYFGSWTWSEYSEELVVCRTSEQRVEVHCHGGRLAAKTIIATLVSLGLRKVSRTEWLDRSEADRFQREAKAMFPHAKTERVLCILLNQVRGAMRRELQYIQSLLLGHRIVEATAAMKQIVAFGLVGARMDRPFSVALVGRPNAGKSSLINAMVGYERAIVFDQPGTTRDLVSVETAIDGWPVVLTDTAGLRNSDDKIEQEGIRLAIEATMQADLVLEIHEAVAPESQRDPEFKLAVADVDRLSVGTKADLASPAGVLPCDVLTSAKTGEGISVLSGRIMQKLIPFPLRDNTAVPLSQETLDVTKQILDALEDGQVEVAREMINGLLA